MEDKKLESQRQELNFKNWKLWLLEEFEKATE